MFRYLAAEGFLPGYNFTRLASAFLLEKGGTGETNAAYGVAWDEAMKQAGVKFKKWLTSRNENLRPSHQAAEGQTVGLREVLIVGATKLMFPGDPAGLRRRSSTDTACRLRPTSKGLTVSTQMLRHHPNFGPKP